METMEREQSSQCEEKRGGKGCEVVPESQKVPSEDISDAKELKVEESKPHMEEESKESKELKESGMETNEIKREEARESKGLEDLDTAGKARVQGKESDVFKSVLLYWFWDQRIQLKFWRDQHIRWMKPSIEIPYGHRGERQLHLGTVEAIGSGRLKPRGRFSEAAGLLMSFVHGSGRKRELSFVQSLFFLCAV